jgi:hypothetical protein
VVPTIRPGYTIADTGPTAELRLAEACASAVRAELADREVRQARQRAGLTRAAELVGRDALVSARACR